MNLYQFTVDRVTALAKLNVYATGTTTPATFYTDAAGTTTGTSPLNADGAGQFAPIYLDPSITYRIKVTNTAGSTTYYDIDPVSLTDEGTADGVLMVRSIDDAKKRTIPANVSAVYCAAYANKGDRGQALYARVASAPTTHAAWFQSADGGYWDLSENVLNPFMFGAKGDGVTNDSPAIQAMFDYVDVSHKDKAYPFNFMGAKFFLNTGLILPKVSAFTILDINGGGATLHTNQAITILSNAVPTDQTQAGVQIGRSSYEIHDLLFEGTNVAGQVGLHLIANYTPVVRNCYFDALDYGSIGTFCIASAWRDNRYHGCAVRGATIQAGDSFLTGAPLWTGATVPNSGCNVSVFENCRVFGHASQTSSFGIFGSDSVRMEGCISEGAGAKYDVHFDYQAATVIKQFHVHMFHAEAPNSKLNFKVRTAGKVFIDTLWSQYPAAIYDGSGSGACDIIIRGINYLGNPPLPNALPFDPVTNPNPKGRWFYHTDGNGYGVWPEATTATSSGSAFRFEDCFDNAYALFGDPAKWEGVILPLVVNVRGKLGANAGIGEWSNAGIVLNGPIYLQDGSTMTGMQTGVVHTNTTTVAANSSVTENIAAVGLKFQKSTVFVNPYNGAYVPPAGIVWNAWVEADDAFKIRFTNVTGSSLSVPTAAPGVATWRYCAPRHV